jgi:hypothetical protein
MPDQQVAGLAKISPLLAAKSARIMRAPRAGDCDDFAFGHDLRA